MTFDASSLGPLVLIAAVAFGAFLPASGRGETLAPGLHGRHRLYVHLLEPKEHPDYERRHVRPPTWATFGNRTRFTSLRGFAVKDGRVVDYAREI